jgi:hypothetical protein
MAKKSQTSQVASPIAQQRPATPPEPSLIDRYHQSEGKLLEIVKQLHNPKDVATMQLLRNADDCIKIMVQTTQRINAASALVQSFS